MCGCDCTAMEMCVPVRMCEWVAGGVHSASVEVESELCGPGWERA